jgi:malate synthase
MTNKLTLPDGVTVTAIISRATEAILVPKAIELVAALHRNFNQRRKELLERRQKRQADFDAGKTPDFLAETESVRRSELPSPRICRIVGWRSPVRPIARW